jgi:SAM-dependent methyltransferase
MAKVGRYEVPEDWPVKGEAGRRFSEKLKNGFFSTYMAGEVTIDVGYRGAFEDAVPILPHAIGVDLDYPEYDGKKLPFPDESVDTVYSSHMLEHVADFRATICDWHRVVRSGGFIVCVVPHQFLYEKRRNLPSSWNADHKRFYTPTSLLREFETSLQPNTYRVRHLRDNDEDYTYAVGPEAHSGGGYEIELVVQKITPPGWDLAGPSDPLQDGLESAQDEVSRLTAERDALSRESARWFDAAILAPAERVLRTSPPGRGRGWRRLARSVQAGFRRTNWDAIEQADRARDSGKWERAARLYLDGLSTTPDASELWLQLGQALEATGKHAEAAFAFREAEGRTRPNRGSRRSL